MTEMVISYIFNVLLGIIMYFMKQNSDGLRDRLAKVEDDVGKVKDTYFKKEDFREFKDELWTRLDKMENTFERRLHEVSK
jgi:hypothetical protein